MRRLRIVGGRFRRVLFPPLAEPVVEQQACRADGQRDGKDQDGAPVVFGAQRVAAHGGGDDGGQPAQ